MSPTTTSSMSSVTTLTTTVPEYPCPSNEFYCGRGKCIHLSWLCDIITDCFDVRAEIFCNRCAQSEFNCNNGECIAPVFVCNGNDNCGNRRDELACPGIGFGPFLLHRGNERLWLAWLIIYTLFWACCWLSRTVSFWFDLKIRRKCLTNLLLGLLRRNHCIVAVKSVHWAHGCTRTSMIFLILYHHFTSILGCNGIFLCCLISCFWVFHIQELCSKMK